jgi:hypothetical protein
MGHTAAVCGSWQERFLALDRHAFEAALSGWRTDAGRPGAVAIAVRQVTW